MDKKTMVEVYNRILDLSFLKNRYEECESLLNSIHNDSTATRITSLDKSVQVPKKLIDMCNIIVIHMQSDLIDDIEKTCQEIINYITDCRIREAIKEGDEDD